MSRTRKLENEKRSHVKFSIRAISCIRILASVMSTGFILKIFWSFLQNITPSPQAAWGLVQITVIIYFVSWFVAALKGIKLQASVLNTTRGVASKIPLSGYLVLLIGFPIGTASLFLVLYGKNVTSYIAFFWDRSITELLVVLLLAFWVWDICWHLSVRKTASIMIKASKENLAGPPKRYFELEQISELEKFLFGKWRVLRMAFGFCVISSLLSLVALFREHVSIPHTDLKFDLQSVIAVVTFGFILISEVWIWMMRFRLLISVDVVGSLGSRYNLSMKPNKPLQRA